MSLINFNLDKKTLQNWVSLALWGPVFLLLYGAAIGGAGALIRYGVLGEPLPINASPDGEMVGYGILAALGFIYYLNLQYTYGKKELRSAQEGLAEAKETFEDEAENLQDESEE